MSVVSILWSAGLLPQYRVCVACRYQRLRSTDTSQQPLQFISHLYWTRNYVSIIYLYTSRFPFDITRCVINNSVLRTLNATSRQFSHKRDTRYNGHRHCFCPSTLYVVLWALSLTEGSGEAHGKRKLRGDCLFLVHRAVYDKTHLSSWGTLHLIKTQIRLLHNFH
jgi:hypothetical protein